MSDVELEIGSDGVAVITLNAPARRNCLTVDVAHAIVAACDRIDADLAVGAAIIRASGPVFCSGADRALLAQVAADPSSEESLHALTTIYEAFARISRLLVPSITAVQGTALGAGMNLAMSADLCFVADDAKLLSGFIPIGAHPGGGHFILVSRKGGPQTAAALGLFGHQLVGAEAVAAGIAFAAFPAPNLDTRALDFARVAGADPALSRQAAASFRLQVYAAGVSQASGSRIEQAAQMWSLRRGKRD